MDPFEVRLTLVGMLHKLTSSLVSMQKAAQFCVANSRRCAPDLWECILEACDNGSLNHRVNLLYLLDTLLAEADKVPSSMTATGEAASSSSSSRSRTNGHPASSSSGILPPPPPSTSSSSSISSTWTELVSRDLDKLVNSVVPIRKPAGGHLNLHACEQVLSSWRTRRLLDRDLLDAAIASLVERRNAIHHRDRGDDNDGEDSANNDDEATNTSRESKGKGPQFSKNDVLRRIEDDRERHKRLRERLWVLPVPATFVTTAPSSSTANGSSARPSPISPFSPSEGLTPGAAATQPAAAAPNDRPRLKGPEVPIELEFEQLWDSEELDRQARGTNALAQEELEAMHRETARWLEHTRVV